MMETLLIRSLVFLMALGSYVLVTPFNICKQEKVTILKQLVEIQQEKGNALKEMVQAQQSVGEDRLQTLEEKLYKLECRLDVDEAQFLNQRVDKLQTLEEKLNKLEGRLDVYEAQKVDKLQALEESQTELSLVLNKLVVSLNQALDVSPMLNKLEGRLDVIEAKMDTQADEMKNKLEAAHVSQEVLQRVEDKLEVTQRNREEVLQRLQVLEHQMDTQADEMKNKLEAAQLIPEEVLQRVEDKLESAQVNHEEGLKRVRDELELAHVDHKEGLQHLEDKLEAAQLSHEEVLQRLEALEHQVEEEEQEEGQVEAGSPEMCIFGCLPPFEAFGDDCLHLHIGYMHWDEAQRYCQNLGASLFIPTAKEGFQSTTSTRLIPDPHPSVLDFLLKKRKQISWGGIYAWIGAVEDDGKRTWTSWEQLHGVINRLDSDEKLSCIRLYVDEDRKYKIWALGCKGYTSFPLCQKQQQYFLVAE